MSSSSSMPLDTVLSMLSNLVSLGRLHTVSIEFTELREKGSETLFHVEILLREAGKKETSLDEITKNIVNLGPPRPKGY